jgi:hypothetical protein
MPSLALLALDEIRKALAFLILTFRHGLQVMDSLTGPASTGMIDHHSIRDRTVRRHPRDDVSSCLAVEGVAIAVQSVRDDVATEDITHNLSCFLLAFSAFSVTHSPQSPGSFAW